MPSVPVAVLALLAASAAAAGVSRVPLRPAAKAATGVELENSWDTFYVGEVAVGTPGQAVRVMFDTQATSVWVPAPAALPPGTAHSAYEPERSNTSRRLRRRFLQQWVEGEWYRDAVALGGVRLPALDFGVASDVSGFAGYGGKPFDGVLGLGFGEGRAPAFVAALAASGQVAAPSFAFFLGRGGAEGELALGGPAPGRYEGKLSLVGLDDSAQWSVPLDSVRVGSKTAGGVRSAIVNPFVSFVHGPSAQVSSVASQWGAVRSPAGLWKVPCDQQGPALAFGIGGREYVLEAADLILRWGDACYLGVAADGSEDRETWYLGQTFMRKFYVLFDAGARRLGFAPAAHGAEDFV